MIPIYIISLKVISPIICPTYTHFAKERKKTERDTKKPGGKAAQAGNLSYEVKTSLNPISTNCALGPHFFK